MQDAHKDRIDNFQLLSLTNDMVLPNGVTRTSDGFFYGKDARNPIIGDQRISFGYIPAQTYSVIGDLAGTALTEHMTSNKRSIALLQAGTHSADAMFETAKNDNANLTWIIRLVGCILLMSAFSMILKPLSVLADIVPLFGSIIGIGTGFVSFISGLILTLMTISIAWIFYRPLLGAALILVVLGLVYLLKRKSYKAAELSASANTEMPIQINN